MKYLYIKIDVNCFVIMICFLLITEQFGVVEMKLCLFRIAQRPPSSYHFYKEQENPQLLLSSLRAVRDSGCTCQRRRVRLPSF